MFVVGYLEGCPDLEIGYFFLDGDGSPLQSKHDAAWDAFMTE